MTQYLQGHHESVLRSLRRWTVQSSAACLPPHLRPSMRVPDVGCEPGTLTDDLAAAV